MTAQTIDITELVETMRSSFVVWASSYIFGAAVSTPGFQWLALPIISALFKAVLNWAFTNASKSTVMGAFFLGTASRKATEADEYIFAVTAKNSLPENASDEEYERAERAEIDSFNRFVCLTQ